MNIYNSIVYLLILNLPIILLLYPGIMYYIYNDFHALIFDRKFLFANIQLGGITVFTFAIMAH